MCPHGVLHAGAPRVPALLGWQPLEGWWCWDVWAPCCGVAIPAVLAAAAPRNREMHTPLQDKGAAGPIGTTSPCPPRSEAAAPAVAALAVVALMAVCQGMRRPWGVGTAPKGGKGHLDRVRGRGGGPWG